jgi:hypothetical protein
VARLLRYAVWPNRLVLAAGTFLFAAIAVRYLAHPVAAGAEFRIVWGSAAARTIARVGFGAFPLALAVFLLGCLVSGRLLLGLALLATVAVIVTGVRVLGLFVDGPAAFTLQVLKPEIALSVLSVFGVLLEARRRRETTNAADVTTGPHVRSMASREEMAR